MTELELTAEVLALAREHQVLAHHCQDPRRCQGDPGLPDLILIGRQASLFAELKSERGDTSPEQDRWLWTIDRTRKLHPHQLWRPSDLASGLIEQILQLIK